MVDYRKTCARALLVMAATATAIPASAQTLYTSRSAFDAASITTLQNFNGAATSSTVSSVTFAPLTFSCSGNTYCPGFFGVRTQGNLGSRGLYFALPDTGVFTFSSPITAFGIDVLDVGTVRGTDFSVTINGITYLLQDDYTSGLPFFFGYTGPAFSSIAFSGTAFGDGVNFDDAAYGSARVLAAVPEPSSWAMMLLGFGALGLSLRRRRLGLARPALGGGL